MAKEIKTKLKENIKPIISVLSVIIILTVSALITPEQWNVIFDKLGFSNSISSNYPMNVHFIDVGQGDCTVIKTDNSKTVLIDSGEDVYSEKVISYLERLNVSKIDFCIITHPHADHVGAMSEILNRFGAETFIMPSIDNDIAPKEEYYSDLLSTVNKTCDNVLSIKDFSSFSIGDISLEIFPPLSKSKELNNMSLVIKASYKDASFVITGDCTTKEENQIIESFGEEKLKCNVLKVGHHGSEYATGENWLNALKPDICVISVGKNNNFGHPSEKLIKTLEERNIQFFRTDINSTLVFKTDGEKIILE